MDSPFYCICLSFLSNIGLRTACVNTNQRPKLVCLLVRNVVKAWLFQSLPPFNRIIVKKKNSLLHNEIKNFMPHFSFNPLWWFKSRIFYLLNLSLNLPCEIVNWSVNTTSKRWFSNDSFFYIIRCNSCNYQQN